MKIEYEVRPRPRAKFHSEEWGYIGNEFGISLESVLFLLPDSERVTKSTITFKGLPEGWVAIMARRRLTETSFWIDKDLVDKHGRVTRLVAFGPFTLARRDFDGHELLIAIHKDIEFQEEIETGVLGLVEYFQDVIGDYQPEILVAIVLPAQAREIEGLGELVGMGEYASFFEIVPENHRYRGSFPQVMMDFPLHVSSTWFGEFEPGSISENAFSWFCNPWRFYYGGRAMVDVFNWSEAEYLESLYHTWLRYKEANAGKEQLPIYRDTVVNNEKKVPLFGYTLNEEIKRVTNGEKSVDDVIHYMYVDFALAGRDVTATGFLQAINKITGHDFTDFFNKYFYGTEEFPLVIEFEQKER